MIIDVKVPQLSESVAEATLVAWHKKVGEAVDKDENLIDNETDKVVLERPSPADGVLVEISGEGEDSLPRDDRHLVVQSMRTVFEAMGVDAPGLVLRCINSIPHGRGLGSSAAAIIGSMMFSPTLAAPAS